MPLTRRKPEDPWKERTRWEVDGSGLEVLLSPLGEPRHWMVGTLLSGQALNGDANQYLRRHKLWQAEFSSRARAVDAVRMALANEPFNPPERRVLSWRRVGEGVYLSSDGHWRLEREKKVDRLLPASGLARYELSSYPRKWGEGVEKMLVQKRDTLHAASLRAVHLNQQLDLEPS